MAIIDEESRQRERIVKGQLEGLGQLLRLPDRSIFPRRKKLGQDATHSYLSRHRTSFNKRLPSNHLTRLSVPNQPASLRRSTRSRSLTPLAAWKYFAIHGWTTYAQRKKSKRHERRTAVGHTRTTQRTSHTSSFSRLCSPSLSLCVIIGFEGVSVSRSQGITIVETTITTPPSWQSQQL